MQMKAKSIRGLMWIFAVVLFAAVACSAVFRRSFAQNMASDKPLAPTAAAKSNSGSTEALRLNTLGVAHMNQQKGAEAQKYFERALAADPNFAPAKMNLGISLLSQQKLESAVSNLEDAS
ncbi:MAG TPA: tetratricopeptide repeat protein, partial [Candidatus Acidoferrum sp.]